jgi:hypothetical protein
VGFAVDQEVDQDVTTGVGLERAHESHPVDGHRLRINAPPVKDRRHLPGRPKLAGDALSGARPGLSFEGYFHELYTSGITFESSMRSSVSR